MKPAHPLDIPQNPTLRTKNFIEYCEKLGLTITESDLELCVEAGLLNPTASDEEDRYYSTFQFYCIDCAQPYISFELDRRNSIKTSGVKVFLQGGKVYLKADLHLEIQIADAEALPTSGGGEYKPLDHAAALEQRFRDRMSGKEALEHLQATPLKFDPFLKFLLAVEDVYMPYAKSNGRHIQVRGNMETWLQKKDDLDLKKELTDQNLGLEDLASWYKELAEQAGRILGAEGDWLQLWRNIDWGKKEKLKGNIRRGVEYLQWALMVKRMLEDYLKREVFDVDEIDNLDPKDIIPQDVNSTDRPYGLLRDSRNKRYSDATDNYYDDRYKRLLYLSNDFRLNYQPTVMVFLEGSTEETILPVIFMDLFGVRHEQMGIEFVTLHGITNFFGAGGKGANKKTINNFKNIMSYNLDKWQTIPFFIADNENDILTLLTTGECLHFDNKNYKLPEGWYALWGQDAEFTLGGKDFEIANYTNKELVAAITELDGTIIVTESQIEGVRVAGDGMKQLPYPYGERVSTLKISLAQKLYDNLKSEYLRTKDDELLKRPVFKVLRRVWNTAVLNHAPHDRVQELANRDVIQDILEGRRSAW